MNGNTWVNPHHRPNRRGPNRRSPTGNKSGPKKRKPSSSGPRGKSASSSTKRSAKQASSIAYQSQATAQDSFLDQLATFAQQVDLPKVRHTLTEMNAVMEQINGLFQKLPRLQSPSVPYGTNSQQTRPQQTQQRHFRQQPYQRPYPFHPVYSQTRNAYHPYPHPHPHQQFPGPYRRGSM